MNYPCAVIQDLLPLYYDGVCSEESSRAIEEHLPQCPRCRACLEAMKKSEQSFPSAEEEEKKAASFRRVKKKLKQRQILIGVGCVALAALVLVTISAVLKNIRRTVEYEDNIRVTMEKAGLVGQLEGTVWNTCASVMLETREGNCLFFCFTDTAWDDLVTGNQTYSHYILCPADKGTGEIEKVYYYTGNYPDLTEMNPQELEAAKKNAVLLWSRGEQ